MTFTEAAEAVLRKVGRALHYKKITQLAIDQNLLSHIGKTPEVTMSTRLATLTKKDSADQNIVRVRPGVFGLREWGPNVSVDADAGAEGEEEAAEAKAPEAPKPATAEPAKPAQKAQAELRRARGATTTDGEIVPPRGARAASVRAVSAAVRRRPASVAVRRSPVSAAVSRARAVSAAVSRGRVASPVRAARPVRAASVTASAAVIADPIVARTLGRRPRPLRPSWSGARSP